MIRWLNKRARCACLFAVLLVTLTGCNGDDARAPQQEGTFETTPPEEPVPDQADTATPGTEGSQTTFAASQVGIPQEPVIGTVTPVPGTEPPPPVMTGGEAIPLTKESEPVPAGPIADVPPAPGRQVVLPLPEPVAPPVVIPEKVTRFTEIAPDTIGGATYVSSPALEYDLGNLIATSAGETYTLRNDDKLFITPVRGWLRFPEKASSIQKIQQWSRFPIIVFLHGNHSTSVKNYQGYDYLAKQLASHGYVVLSIDANVNNDVGDRQSQSRGQLILGTLDRLRHIDEQGQVNLDGTLGALDALKDKLDFSRVGIMGHSRGGQGVSNAIKFNLTRAGVNLEELETALKDNPEEFRRNYPDLADAVTPATTEKPAVNDKKAVAARQAIISTDKLKAAIKKYNLYFAAGRETAEPYDFKGAFMLAPTDYSSNLGINNVPLAVLLPSCDGDVHNLAGARIYDHNRFGPATDTAPRYQILVHGANHNFYNTIWTDDDYNKGSYCNPKRDDAIRLNEEEQQQNGAFIINSFMRYHVGGEQKFAAYWNATAQLPKAACPLTDEHCDKRVVLTLQKNAVQSNLIQRFQAGNSLDRNAPGGSIKLAGFDEYARCVMAFDGTNPDSAIEPGTCSPKRLNDFQYRTRFLNSMRSISDHLELVWSKPAPSIALNLIEPSTKSYDSLTFRIAVVQPIGQEVNVTLIDSAGNTKAVVASEYSDALYNLAPSKRAGNPAKDDVKNALFINEMQPLMNMVAIPLKAFDGIDLTKLKELKLTFPKELGKVAITDIELQNLGREKPDQKVATQQ